MGLNKNDHFYIMMIRDESYKDEIDLDYYNNTKKVGATLSEHLTYLYGELSRYPKDSREYGYVTLLIRQYITWHLTDSEFIAVVAKVE
jgi:hypothetical protein